MTSLIATCDMTQASCLDVHVAGMVSPQQNTDSNHAPLFVSPNPSLHTLKFLGGVEKSPGQKGEEGGML